MSKIARALRSLVGGSVPLRCVQCGRSRPDVKQLVSGPRIYICGSCAHDAGIKYQTDTEKSAVTTCSFCGATTRGVELGPQHRDAICGDCIELVEHILDEADHREQPAR